MNNPLKENEIVALVRRMELMSTLIKRQIQEEIITLVKLPAEWHEDAFNDFLKDEKIAEADVPNWLDQKGWEREDLTLHLALPEALFRFSKQRFGPGLEEHYLSSAANLDTVIYSLVRLRDSLLAKELWMRLCENEVSFLDVASNFGEGPESKRKGLIGPLPIGTLEPPVLRKTLRELSPGEFTPPFQFGGWNLLIRLEQFTPSAFDEPMKEKLLRDQMNKFIEERSNSLLNGLPVEPLHYDC